LPLKREFLISFFESNGKISLIMSAHSAFHFKTSGELREEAERLGIILPWRENIAPLLEKPRLGEAVLPNRMAILPMEGADAYPNGTPSEKTVRRYLRYASGGSGLIWFEAAAVLPEARSNSRQLMLTGENWPSFRSLLERMRGEARSRFGDAHRIYCVLQLTHAGRYSLPRPHYAPPAAGFNPFLDERAGEVRVVEDSELDELREAYLAAARLARHAGFDAVDLKCCHGYLLNDLLGAYSRSGSRYGKTFENRTRILTETMHAVHADLPRLGLASRLSAYDGFPFPYGFGFAKNSPLDVDLTEVSALIRRLLLLGGSLFGLTVGNPRKNPHMTRPFDRPVPGSAPPDEHPLEGVRRLLSVTGGAQKQFPNVPLLGSGYSWLREYFPHVAAAEVAAGNVSLVGMGRGALAYPEAPRDLMEKGRLEPGRVCVTCSRCSELLRAGRPVGCVIRDAEVYAAEYRGLDS
jgi:2,4-dienoyl-CoA reductase-like NADH-dependent reductase (Old Yellow Enzyme family)